MNFKKAWRNHSGGYGRRDELEEADKVWENLYTKLVSSPQYYPEVYVEPGTTLFRVHQGPSKLPEREEFDDVLDYDDAVAAVTAKNESIYADIEFSNHWVSFTDDPEVITSPYFLEKGFTGDVVILKSDKAIRITPIMGLTFEREVVAPLDKTNVIEVLDNKSFRQKYL